MNQTARHDCAVVLCCDKKFFPFALFTIRQIAFQTPDRSFDFVIFTQDDLIVPDWAGPLAIVIHKGGALPEAVGAANFQGSTATLLRLMVARELQDCYSRIAYLDCDLTVEGGDLDRLLQTDLGPHAMGAVLDLPLWLDPGHLAPEYRVMNLSARPYMNAGVLVIDTARFMADRVEERAFDMCRRHPKSLRFADQSMLNMALEGQFAQLAPCWNWLATERLPLASFGYPVFLRHFAGRLKPDRYSGPRLEARHNQAYRDFLTRFMPDRVQGLPPLPGAGPLGLRDLARTSIAHLTTRDAMGQFLARYPDPYKALL